MADERTPFDREREGYAQQAFTFYRYALAAPNEAAHELWRSAESQMQMASLANAPEIASAHASNAAHFARRAMAEETDPSPTQAERDAAKEDTENAERQRKEANRIKSEKAKRTRYERLKAEFEAKGPLQARDEKDSGQ